MEFDLIATSTFGIEGITAKELKSLGYEDLLVENGKVHFTGDEMDIAIANIHLRTAERVFIKMAEFEAKSFEELFQGTKNVKWSDIIPVDGEMHVTGKSVKSTLYSVPDCQSIVKRAIVKSMEESYGISQFSESGPKYKIEVSILKDKVTLSIDTSGEGLHKRGYREKAGIAPLKETLAAAMILMSRWREEDVLVDPFCGSGTLLIEAAMIMQNIAPGVSRRFVCEEWSIMPEDVFQQVRDGARRAVKNKPINLLGYDIDDSVLRVAKKNAGRAKVIQYIKFENRDFKCFRNNAREGFIISNPPYGERIGEKNEVENLYSIFGKYKEKYADWEFNILTSFEGFEGPFKRKADKNRKLYNGRLKCYYYQYFDHKKVKNEGDTVLKAIMD
ncbi:MAG: THUMP domain-containing class I SAM-dependent RNA methyltransferase [Clostridium sp.]